MNHDFLVDVAAGLGGRLLDHRPLTGGVSARVEALAIRLLTGEVRHVVVRQHGRAAWKPLDAEVTQREFGLLRWLHARGLPVPEPLCLLAPPGGAPCFAMSRVEGCTDIADPDRAMPRLADALATLHALPVDEAPPLPEREDPVEGLLAVLPPGDGELRRHLTAAPPHLSPRRSVLHGDYWPGNVIWRGDVIAAVVDWEDAAVGDPLSDVACCRVELAHRFPLRHVEAFTRRYQARTGVDLADLPVWDAYVSAAALGAMHAWGLPLEQEIRMRRRGAAFLARATRALLGNRESSRPTRRRRPRPR